MQALDVKGAAIHYADEGDRGGTPVVFSNSLGTDFRIWDDMIARLGPRLRIIRCPPSGQGLLPRPPQGPPFTGSQPLPPKKRR